jgi:hypothetical protein
MSLIELLVFLALCAGLGFLGNLVSHRYGWIAGAIPAAIVLIIMLFVHWRNLIIETRNQWRRRRANR